MDNRERIIRQVGEFCQRTRCFQCPIYESWKESGTNKTCIECLAFPDIAKKIAEMTKQIRVNKEDEHGNVAWGRNYDLEKTEEL